MYNFLKNNFTSRYRLIGKINGMATDARKTRFRLVKKAKAEKSVNALAARKREVSKDIRHHLLAYAFMRGTPYAKLERKCREDNKPSAEKILDIVRMHYSFLTWRIEQVQEWLSNGEVK